MRLRLGGLVFGRRVVGNYVGSGISRGSRTGNDGESQAEREAREPEQPLRCDSSSVFGVHHFKQANPAVSGTTVRRFEKAVLSKISCRHGRSINPAGPRGKFREWFVQQG